MQGKSRHARRHTSIAIVTVLLIVVIGLAAVPAAGGSGTETPSQMSASPTLVADGDDDGRDKLQREDVSFSNGELTLHGTVVAPAGADAGRPAVVLVPGAGEGVPRTHSLPHAEAFAHAGIVSLIYDKRTAADGYSLFEASFDDLADDAIAGVRLLADRPDVDPDLIGVHGHSEGGWTVAVAGNRSTDIAFVILAAASVRSPERTQVWMNQTQLRHAGVTESLLRPLGKTLTRHVVAADRFRLAGHDPIAPLQQLEQPTLAVFAEHDRNAPPGESLRLIGDALDRGGNTHHALRVIDDAHHLMVPSRDGFDVDVAEILGSFDAVGDLSDSDATLLPDLAPAYVESVTVWVHDIADGAAELARDPAPPQGHDSVPLAPLAAHESLGVQAAAVGMLLLTFASYPAIAVVRRLRGRRERSVVRWPARVLAVSGLAVVVLSPGYLTWIMLTAAMQPGPVVAGRPLTWLLLQLGAVGIVVAAAALAVRWRQARHRLTTQAHFRFGALAVGALVFLPWAAYWGLFTA